MYMYMYMHVLDHIYMYMCIHSFACKRYFPYTYMVAITVAMGTGNLDVLS